MVSMPSISGIMMSISTMSIGVCGRQDAHGVAAVAGGRSRSCRAPRARWSARRCCGCRRPRSAPSGRSSTASDWCRSSSRRCACLGQPRHVAVQEEGGQIEQPLAASAPGARVMPSQLLQAHARPSCLAIAAARAPAGAPSSAVASLHRTCDHVGDVAPRRARRRSGNRPSCAASAIRSAGRIVRVTTQILAARSHCTMPSRSAASALDHQQRRLGRLMKSSRFCRARRRARPWTGSAWRRSPARRPRRRRSRASSVETTHTGMCRVDRSFFSRSMHPPALHVGQARCRA